MNKKQILLLNILREMKSPWFELRLMIAVLLAFRPLASTNNFGGRK